jgi:hypothetical protein
MPRLTQSETLRIRAIFQQIDELIYTTNRGAIEGVHFDLKHKYFDVTNYDVPRALFKLPKLRPRGPILYFPWTEFSKSYDQQQVDTTEPSEEYIYETQELTVVSGDRISISRIDIVPVEERLRGCNLGRRNIFLAIKRRNEEILELKIPIILVPKAEIWEENSIGNYYGAIRNRIENYFDITNATKMTNIQSTDAFSERALRKLQVLLKIHGVGGLEVIRDATSTVVLPTVQSDEIYDDTNIWFTINDAVALGYLWAKSEDQRNWAPFGEMSVVQQYDAGLESGVSRSRDAEAWNKVFEELIKGMLDRPEKLTKAKIIANVRKDENKQWDSMRKKLNLPNAAMPGEESLKKAYTKIMRTLSVKAGESASLDIASDGN